jgi:hypothetical protein
MKTINKILILIIICLIIVCLTKGNILNIINKYFVICKNRVEGFLGLMYTNKNGVYYNHPSITYDRQLDYPYLDTDHDNYQLYQFLNSLITTNVNNNELTASNKNKIPADIKLVNQILSHLNNKFNSYNYRFMDIKLLDNIYYHVNPRGKEIELFNISTNVYLQNKPIGHIILNIEIFLRDDIDNGLTINNIKLIQKKNIEKINNNEPSGNINSPSQYQKNIDSSKFQCSNIQKNAIQKAQNMNTIMNDLFNNTFVNRDQHNDLFIKSNNDLADSDNSLIPTIIDI